MTKETTDWQQLYPDKYLHDYYGAVEPDEQQALKYLINFFRIIPVAKGSSLLELGCGPTVHRAIAASRYVGSIILADLLPSNLQAVQSWVDKSPHAHNWNAFTQFILQQEGVDKPSNDDIILREEQTRELIKSVRPADLMSSDPLGPENRGQFNIVLVPFCLEVAGQPGGVERFNLALHNALSLVKPKGVVITMDLYNANAYKLDGSWLTCYPVRELDLQRGFKKAGFGSVEIQVDDVPKHTEQGYSAVVFAAARR